MKKKNSICEGKKDYKIIVLNEFLLFIKKNNFTSEITQVKGKGSKFKNDQLQKDIIYISSGRITITAMWKGKENQALLLQNKKNKFKKGHARGDSYLGSLLIASKML